MCNKVQLPSPNHILSRKNYYSDGFLRVKALVKTTQIVFVFIRCDHVQMHWCGPQELGLFLLVLLMDRRPGTAPHPPPPALGAARHGVTICPSSSSNSSPSPPATPPPPLLLLQ